MIEELEDEFHACALSICRIILEISVDFQGKPEDDAEVDLGIIAIHLGIVKPMEKIRNAILWHLRADVLNDNHKPVANLRATSDYTNEVLSGEAA